MTARNLHAEITARIVALLEQGTIPWKQPWSNYAAQATGSVMPRNAVTGRAYSGANVALLWATSLERGYTKPEYLTFKQAQEAGGTVRKGERGSLVVYTSTFEKEDDAGDKKRIAFLKAFTVFNVAQCDGLPEKMEPAPVKPRHQDARQEDIEAFLASTGADIRHGEARAYFTSKHDYIMLPVFESFRSASSYYATAFHELTHWTGHEARLNRTFGKRFGDSAYAAEELVAELGSAFIAAEFGIDNDTLDASAAYLEHWLDALKKDDRLFVAAASAASKAVEHLRGLALASEDKIAA